MRTRGLFLLAIVVIVVGVGVALYRGAGFAEIPAYGEYTRSAVTSVCMAKEL